MDEKIIKKNAVPVIIAAITGNDHSAGLFFYGPSNGWKYFCRKNERCL